MTIEAMEVANCDLHCFNGDGFGIDAKNRAYESFY
jgi:hypothetical protein